MIAPKDPHEPIRAEMWEQLRAAWPDGERLKAQRRKLVVRSYVRA